MANILLITHWTGGDVLPFIKIGTMLKKRGHRVVLFTHCHYEQMAAEKQLEFVALDTLEEFETMNEDLWMLTDPIHRVDQIIMFNQKYHGKEKLLNECEKIRPYCKENDTVILARHRSSISGLLIAEQMNLPYASVILAPNYLAHMAIHEELFGKQLCLEINQAREELQLKPIKSWKDWLYSPKRILAVWPKWFASEEDWPSGLETIGFISGYESEDQSEGFTDEIQRVLQLKTKVALITGGSSKMVASTFYKVAAEACARAQLNAILVTFHDEQVPRPLPKGIIRAKDVNLKQLMKKVDLIIHHGGMGTLNEAIAAGIPQVVLPHLTDGPDNAQKLAKLGIAKSFPEIRWEADVIAKALDHVLTTDFKKQCTIYAEKMYEGFQDLSWINLIEKMIGNINYTPIFIDAPVADAAEGQLEQKKPSAKLTRQQLLYLIKQKQVK